MRPASVLLAVVSLFGLSACDAFGGGLSAEPDTAQTARDQSVVIDVLANDDGDDLSFYDYDETSENGGEVEFADRGRDVRDALRYTPPTGFVGTDRFSYTMTDGTYPNDLPATSTATVTVTVR